MKDEQRFDGYAKRMREMFPTWTAIRKDPDSVGGQFLSVLGLSLDEVAWMLDYAYDQVYLKTADVDHIDLVYKARIPNGLTPQMNFRFIGNSHILLPKETELAFIEGLKGSGAHAALQQDVSCYIDFETKTIYVKQPFGKNETYLNGSLSLSVYGEDGAEPVHEVLPLMPSPVWNFFDEFGLLLGVSRLEGERNRTYRERILDVFRRPANATKTGLLNGIARELGLTRQLNWKDSAKELVIREPRVDIASIQVDGDSLSRSGYRINEDECVVLLPTEDGGEKEVRYVAGVSLHELHDEADIELQNRLYDIDGNATPLLTYYIESIRRLAPIMWGEWRWNQGTWEAGDQRYAGYNTLPTLLDGNTSGWTQEEETTWN